MGLILKDKFIILKDKFDFDCFKNQLLKRLKKHGAYVDINYQGEITWNSISPIWLMKGFIIGRLASTKGKICIERYPPGGWKIRVEIDATILAIVAIIFSIVSALLTMKGKWMTILGMLLFTFNVAWGITGVNTAKKTIQKLIREEIDAIRPHR